MPVTEWRQEARQPALVPHQPEEELCVGSLAPGLVSAILPDPITINPLLVPGQPDGRGDDRLAFAVYPAAEPSCRSGSASHNPRADCRLVVEDVSDETLLKHVAEGDKAAMHIMFARHRKRVFRSSSGWSVIRQSRTILSVRCSLMFGVRPTGSKIAHASPRGCSRSPVSRQPSPCASAGTRPLKVTICLGSQITATPRKPRLIERKQVACCRHVSPGCLRPIARSSIYSIIARSRSQK